MTWMDGRVDGYVDVGRKIENKNSSETGSEMVKWINGWLGWIVG